MTFHVYHRSIHGKTVSIVVTKAPEAKDTRKYPIWAEFPVSQEYTEESQFWNARRVRDVLNGYYKLELTEKGEKEIERIEAENAQKATETQNLVATLDKIDNAVDEKITQEVVDIIEKAKRPKSFWKRLFG